MIWARDYGKGRVLYNGLGHSREAWERPEIQEMWLEMVRVVDGPRARRRHAETGDLPAQMPTKFAYIASPICWLFSGWNWQAIRFSRQTTAGNGSG